MAVTWVQITGIFVITWWLVLFMVLPFGASAPKIHEKGMAKSAPARPRILQKMLLNTVISAVVTLLITIGIHLYY